MASFFAVALFVTASFAAPVKHKTVPSKTTAKKKPAVQLVAARNTRTVGGRTVKSRSRRRPAHVAPAPTYQLHPDPERYQQIQQALTERGYYKGQVNGAWGDDSADALKRFQTDRKMDPDGKINALSLTGLGLGPRHDGTTASTVPLSATNASPLDPPLDLPAASPLPFDLPQIPPPTLNPQ